MKKKLRKLTAVFLTVVMLLGVIALAPITASATSRTADEAINWCASKVGQALDYDGAYGAQCVDFIMYYYQYLGVTGGGGNACDYASNALPAGFTRTAGGKPQKGDILIYTGGYGHVAIYESDNYSYHQNWNGQYVQKVNRYYGNSVWVQAEGVTKTYWGCIHPNFSGGGNNPEGNYEGASGGEGTVYVGGWAFDRDNVSVSLEIHVYIGGSAGDPNAEGHSGIIANVERSDVNAAFGCGNYHGFGATISTNKRGNQPVYVYAINIGSGENVCLGSLDVYINNSSQPRITALENTIKSKESFRVCAVVDNPSDVWEVRIATWTQNDQSDLKWTYATFNGYITYYVDLSRSDFANSKRYINHVYVYDYSGNISDVGVINVEYNPPSITDVVISQVSTRGIRVSCKVDGETNITRVSFPTWPAADGNPIWHEATNMGNGYFTTYISTSEHNNPQSMAFHIYAYDAYGSESAWGTGSTQITDEPMEFGAIKYKSNKYIFYNTALSWEDANKWCKDNGGHLVTIKDQDEWNAVSDLLNQANGARCWLGASSKTGEWKWVTGEEITFDAWDSGQPDNAGGIEYYLGTYSSDSTLPERSLITCYNWNDYNSEYKAGFVCEFDDYYKIGDINRDNSIDIRDVTAIQRHISELELFTEEQLAVADTDGDGEVTVADATLLQMYLAEYDVTFG